MKHVFPFMMVVSLGLSSGRYGDAFLNMGGSVRSISLGQATAALLGHPGGYLENPASVSFLTRTTFYGMAVSQFGLANYTSAGLVIPINETWAGGLHLANLLIDGIPERPDLRTLTELETRRDSIRALTDQGFSTFQDRETALTLSVVRSIQKEVNLGWQFSPFNVRIPVGMNLRMISKSLYDLGAQGIGLDLGSALQVNLREFLFYDWIGDLTIGFSLRDVLGTRLFWSSDKEELIPMKQILGFNYYQRLLKGKVTARVLAQSNSLYPDETQLGLELIVLNKLIIRAGDAGGFMRGGMGITFERFGKAFELDYSFSDHVLGNAHRLGGSIAF